MKRLRRSDRVKHALLVTLREVWIWANAFLMLFPLVFMILSSGKSQLQLTQEPFALPNSFAQIAENYKSVITGVKYFYADIPTQFYTPYFLMIKNSLVLTVSGLFFLIVCSAPIGYVLGARKFPGKRAVMLFLIFIQTVPLFGYLVSFHFLMSGMHMTDNQIGIGMIYAAVSMPSTVIYLRGFYSSYPTEIEEAAKIDGAGELQRYFMIVLPTSTNILVAMILINFMGYWNEYAITNLLTTEMSLKTVSINLMSTAPGDYTYSMALLVLAAIPTFLFFTIFQKRIINSNLTMGALKG